MKLKTSVAAVIVAFTATGAWAGPAGTSQADSGEPEATAAQPSAASAATTEALEWKFVNGQAAGSENPAGSSQAATTDAQDGSDQAAAAEEQGGSDQAANSEEPSDGGQAAMSEDESGQSARSEDQDESGQSANSDNPMANMKDKVVVIIPRDWKGSIPDLIAALEASPDAKDIVIVQQDEPQAGNEPGDEYQASKMTPAINQQ